MLITIGEMVKLIKTFPEFNLEITTNIYLGNECLEAKGYFDKIKYKNLELHKLKENLDSEFSIIDDFEKSRGQVQYGGIDLTYRFCEYDKHRLHVMSYGKYLEYGEFRIYYIRRIEDLQDYLKLLEKHILLVCGL
jgi:hypothetical protein